MMKRTVQKHNRLGRISLVVMAMVLATLWATGAAGAAPPLSKLFAGPPPTMVNYQGLVNVGGSPFDGTGYFKFAIVDSDTGDGNINYWANDGTGDNEGSGEPGTAIALSVSNGLFNVLLGDTSISGMSESMTDNVFRETDTYLRVWFSQNPGGPFEALEPNQRIASVPYALHAKYAENAPSGSTTPPGAVMFFDLASCPTGWSEFTEARGRTVVGLPAAGTLKGTVGSALSNTENRSHTHNVDPPNTSTTSVGNHVHSIIPPTFSSSSDGLHSHDIKIPNTSTLAGGTHSHQWASFDGSIWRAGSGEQIFIWNSGGVATSGTSAYRPLTRFTAQSWDTSTNGAHFHNLDIPNFRSYSDGNHNHTIDSPNFSSASGGGHLHSIDLPSTTSTTASTGDVIPYLQLLTCRKD